MSQADNTLIGKNYAEYKRDKKFLLSSNAFLAALCLLLAYAMVTKDEVIVMVPPQMDAEVKIINGKGNEEYQKRFAFSFANLVGNVNPRNVDFIIEQMSKTFSPALQEAVGVKLANEARILRSRDLKATFVIDDMLYNKHRDIVWVWGDRTIKGDGIPPITENYTYEFRIEPLNGFPRVVHYDAYEGHPITQQIKQRADKVEKRFYTEDQMKLSEGLEVQTNRKPVDSETQTEVKE